MSLGVLIAQLHNFVPCSFVKQLNPMGYVGIDGNKIERIDRFHSVGPGIRKGIAEVLDEEERAKARPVEVG